MNPFFDKVTSFWLLLSILSERPVTKERIQRQDRILKAVKGELNQNNWFRVRFASESGFKSFWKFWPWEATGILVLNNSGAKFYCSWLKWETLEIVFEKNKATVEWVGSNWLPNGALSWFALNKRGERFYFTSETGAFIFGSHQQTIEIYTKLLQHLETT